MLVDSSPRTAVVEVRGLPAQAVASVEVAHQLNKRGWNIVFVAAKIPAWLASTYPELMDDIVIIQDRRIEKRRVFASFFRIIAAVARVTLSSNESNAFTAVRIFGTPVGDLIADSAIRRGGAQMRRWRYWILFFRYALIAEQVLLTIRLMVKRNDVELIVSSSQSYASLHGLLTRFGHANQIAVINCAPTFIAFTKRDPEKSGFRMAARKDALEFVRSVKESPEISRAVAEFGALRFSRESVNPDYRRLEIARSTQHAGRTGSQLEEVLKEAHGERVLFVAPHVFSDAVHMDGSQIFRDYLDWFRNTVDAIQDAPSALWITKEHPLADDYGEQDLVAGVLEKHDRKSRVRLLDPRTSPSAIVAASDAVITVRGTVGLEFGAHGKIALLAGSARYSHLGFTISPRSKEEYFSALKSLPLLPPVKCNPGVALAALYYFELHLIEQNIPSSCFSADRVDLDNDNWGAIAGRLEAARQRAADPFLEKISDMLDTSPRRYVYE
jgi:hypothetical protein